MRAGLGLSSFKNIWLAPLPLHTLPVAPRIETFRERVWCNAVTEPHTDRTPPRGRETKISGWREVERGRGDRGREREGRSRERERQKYKNSSRKTDQKDIKVERRERERTTPGGRESVCGQTETWRHNTRERACLSRRERRYRTALWNPPTQSQEKFNMKTSKRSSM